MLQIYLPEARVFDETKEEFLHLGPMTLRLEHSLISVHKWESKWHKSYLHSQDLTMEEVLDYVRCMSLDSNIDVSVLNRLTEADYKQIEEYIHNPMTATTFPQQRKKRNAQIVTSEIIYYWMINFGIPFDCAKWHLNQLLALIEVCNEMGSTDKKNDPFSSAKSRAAINAARRAKTGSRG